MSQTIFIHIGMHKTGTTAVQHFLTRNADLLKAKGTLVPVSARPEAAPDGHHELPWSLRRYAALLPRWDELKAEIRASGCSQVCLSSEEFDYCDLETIQKIRGLLDGFSVKIVVYLRNQIEFCESLFRTTVLHYGESAHFDRYINRCHPRLDYHQMLLDWAEGFGRDQLIARLYDKQQLLNGDIVDDFRAQLGIPDDAGYVLPPKGINHGLPSPAITAIRLLRLRGASEATVRKLTTWAYTELTKTPDARTSFVSRSEAELLMQNYAESNEKLRQAFFPDVAEPLFQDLGSRPMYRAGDSGDIADVLKDLIDTALVGRYES